MAMEIKWIDLGDGNKIVVEVDDSFPVISSLTNQIDDEGNRPISSKLQSSSGLTLLDQINGLASMIKKTAESSRPDEIEITGQVKFSGETGIPIFVKAKGETAFQIKLSWKSRNK